MEMNKLMTSETLASIRQLVKQGMDKSNIDTEPYWLVLKLLLDEIEDLQKQNENLRTRILEKRAHFADWQPSE